MKNLSAFIQSLSSESLEANESLDVEGFGFNKEAFDAELLREVLEDLPLPQDMSDAESLDAEVNTDTLFEEIINYDISARLIELSLGDGESLEDSDGITQALEDLEARILIEREFNRRYPGAFVPIRRVH